MFGFKLVCYVADPHGAVLDFFFPAAIVAAVMAGS